MQHDQVIAAGENARRMLGFLHLGCVDYLGARMLLSNGLVLQGAVLASTAIEKYFKAIIASRQTPKFGHLSQRQLDEIAGLDPSIMRDVNRSYVQLLEKCYPLRYMDAFATGTSFALSARALLAETDFAVAAIEARFRFVGGSGKPIQSHYAHLHALRAPQLITYNHVVHGVPKRTFVETGPDWIYEIRNHPG